MKINHFAHAAKQTQYKPNTNPIKAKKMFLGAPKILTITEAGANLKKRIAFRLFLERTLFGR